MDLLDRFRIDAENQALKYAVSKVMFCQMKGYDKILDYRKAVMIESLSGNFFLMCEDCFNSSVTRAILGADVTQRVIRRIVRYQDWNKLQAEELKKIAIEKQQLKLDLFSSMSKN